MKVFITREIAEFRKLSLNARDLLKSFLFFEIFSVISDIFTGAYIFQKLDSVEAVAIYYAANFITIPIFFYINGYLLRKTSVLKLFLLGSIFLAISPLILVIIPTLNHPILVLLGFIAGMGMAFYWANRNYLTLDSTTDDDRNFFFGLSSTLQTAATIISPTIAGYLIVFGNTHLFATEQGGYILTMILGFLFIIAAVWILRDNKFHKPETKQLFVKKVHKKWHIVRLVTTLHIVRHGLMVFLPSMIILIVLKGEAQLGTVNTLASLAGALFSYSLGRKIKAADRIYIYAFAAIVFAIGAISLVAFFNPFSVIIFMIALRISSPNFFNSMSGIWFKYINLFKGKNESNYTYLCDLEIYIALGRMIGIGILLGVIHFFGQENGVRYTLLAIPLSHAIIIGLIRWLENHQNPRYQ